jgi:uncharacterized repeat protein (TIGR01451 family)
MKAPASIGAGQEIEYKICIENCTSAAAHHVLVRNPLPANARFVRAKPEPAVQTAPEIIWRLGTLAACARQELTLILAPAGDGDIQNCARVQFEHGECVTTRIHRPALSLEKKGPTQALVNDTLSYKLTLTNSGEGELNNVLVTDILPAGLEHATGRKRLSWIVGNLAPGQAQQVEYQVVARTAGKLCNKVIATAAGEFRKEMESCVTVGEGRLEVSMTGPRKSYVNSPATFQINVSNSGTAPLTNVVVTDPLPVGTTLVHASVGGTIEANQLQWNLGTLAAGAGTVLELVVRPTQAGLLCNDAVAVADRGHSKRADACTDVAGLPALSLAVQDLQDPIEVGASTAYAVTVGNPGSVAATHVRIAVTLPQQLELSQATGPAQHRQFGQRVFFDPVTVAPGAEARYRVEVKARRAGDARFRVELTADQLTSGAVQQEESTTIFSSLSSL